MLASALRAAAVVATCMLLQLSPSRGQGTGQVSPRSGELGHKPRGAGFCPLARDRTAVVNRIRPQQAKNNLSEPPRGPPPAQHAGGETVP